MLHLRTTTDTGGQTARHMANHDATTAAAARPAFASAFAPSGIARNAVVETLRGLVLARELRVGDRVITRDGGARMVRWIGQSTVRYSDDAPGDAAGGRPAPRPIRIRAGALGSTEAAGNLVIAPGQRIRRADRRNRLLFATDEVLVRAGDLTHLDGIDTVARDVGHWVHVLFDRHELIRVNGIWMESFAPDLWSIRASHPDHWATMTEALPRLKFDAGQAAYAESRVSLNAREARLLVA